MLILSVCSSNVVSLEALLIEPSKAAFVVYLDVVCLNYDGSVLDAAVLACLGALQQRKSFISPPFALLAADS